MIGRLVKVSKKHSIKVNGDKGEGIMLGRKKGMCEVDVMGDN